MERQLFSWKEWDHVDLLTLRFLDCTVVKAFGPFSVGDKLSEVIIDFDTGHIDVSLGLEQEPWSGKLTLIVEAV